MLLPVFLKLIFFLSIHIQQDPELRLFHIEKGGTVLNSDYGVLNFYDDEKNLQWINQYDSLYDPSGKCIGKMTLASDVEWFWQRKSLFYKSTLIDLFSAEDELILKMEGEEDGKTFIFDEPETHKPIAIALWKWIPTGRCYFSWWDTYIQDWELTILEEDYLSGKNITEVFLIWALLKHSQKHLPEPRILKYVNYNL